MAKAVITLRESGGIFEGDSLTLRAVDGGLVVSASAQEIESVEVVADPTPTFAVVPGDLSGAGLTTASSESPPPDPETPPEKRPHDTIPTDGG